MVLWVLRRKSVESNSESYQLVKESVGITSDANKKKYQRDKAEVWWNLDLGGGLDEEKC